MISSQFENMILCGKAKARILNIGSTQFNYNLGRGTNLIIEKLRINPLNRTTTLVATADTLQATLNQLNERQTFFTLTIYDNNKIEQITFKNKLSVSSVIKEDENYIIAVSSFMDTQLDCFYHFSGENVTFEISTDQFVYPLNLTAISNAIFTSKLNNPYGFTQMVDDLEYTNLNIRPQGQNSDPGILNSLSFNELIMPKIGAVNAGNSANILSTAAEPGKQLNEQILLNVGIIEYKSKDYESL